MTALLNTMSLGASIRNEILNRLICIFLLKIGDENITVAILALPLIQKEHFCQRMSYHEMVKEIAQSTGNLPLGCMQLPWNCVARINDHPDCGPKALNQPTWSQGYKTFFMLSSAETKIYHAHKC